MSDKPDIEAIKARLAELRRADEEYVSVTANRPAMEPEYNYHLRVARREVEAHAPDDIAALLAEVERLKRERSEWCDQADRRLTDYMTQQRDLLAEVAALRARLTLTPEKTATAYLAWEHAYASTQNTPEGAVRRALLAAGMEEEQ